MILDEHRQYLSDSVRVAALSAAIHRVVKPGDIVVDLGAGTGILGLVACRAGASRVYAIEEGGMIEVAREIARANGCRGVRRPRSALEKATGRRREVRLAL